MAHSVSKRQLNTTVLCCCQFTAKRVNGGSLNTTMMWSPKPNEKFTLIKITLNLCDLVRDVTYSCPLNPGNYSVIYRKNVPDVFPKVEYQHSCNNNYDSLSCLQGLYDTQVTAADQNGKELICVKTEISLV